MLLAEQRLLDAARRSHFRHFARGAFSQVSPCTTLEWNWHLDAICHHLEMVQRGEIKRLIIEVPPRSLKSFLASIAFPAFCLGNEPSSEIIAASYSIELAGKLQNDCRALMRSPWYINLFPHIKQPWLKDTETTITTAQRGHRIATSTGGTLTGRGGNLIILDDPLRADDALSEHKRTAVRDWFRNTLYSRVNDKRDGAIVLVMQRLHIDDLAGDLRQQPGWTILSLPAIAPVAQSVLVGSNRYHRREIGDLLHPTREPQHVLDDMRATLGSYHFSAQYQQEPVPVEGELVKWSWFKPFETLPDRDYQIVQSWDVAVKADTIHDYSVCTTWAVVGRDYYLLHVLRARMLFPDLLRSTIAHARQWRADTILIEDKASGTSLIQQLNEQRLIGVPRPIAINPTMDKVSRMSAETSTIEAGHVYIQAGATWHDALRSELVQFPNGRHDDQVDSISQFLNYMRVRRIPQIGTCRIR